MWDETGGGDGLSQAIHSDEEPDCPIDSPVFKVQARSGLGPTPGPLGARRRLSGQWDAVPPTQAILETSLDSESMSIETSLGSGPGQPVAWGLRPQAAGLPGPGRRKRRPGGWAAQLERALRERDSDRILQRHIRPERALAASLCLGIEARQAYAGGLCLRARAWLEPEHQYELWLTPHCDIYPAPGLQPGSEVQVFEPYHQARTSASQWILFGLSRVAILDQPVSRLTGASQPSAPVALSTWPCPCLAAQYTEPIARLALADEL